MMEFNTTMIFIEETFKDLKSIEGKSDDYYAGITDFKNKFKEKISTVLLSRECKTCKRGFVISINTAKWLEEKGLKLFTHCTECRLERRK